jgi:hypothetical protein
MASLDRPTTLSLLTISKGSYNWILPIMYHSITFASAAQLNAFYASHNGLDDATANRVLLIQQIWIGNTPITHDDLQYGSTAWPITAIHRILWTCTNLRALYIIGLDQNQWYRLENAIPASLDHLAMGPVHGPFFIKNLTRRPRISYFTSIQSFMRDDEVQEVVIFPHMRLFRRIADLNSRNMLTFALEQASCISKSETLAEMQLLICGGGQHDEPVLELKARVLEFTDDKRVVVRSCPDKSWIDFLRSEFLAEAEVFISGSM